MANIEHKVKQIVADKLGVDYDEVQLRSSFTNDLGADSLDTVELIMELEKEFGINIPDDRAEGIATVGDAIAYIENSMGGDTPSYSMQTSPQPPTPQRPTPQPRRENTFSSTSYNDQRYDQDDSSSDEGKVSGNNSFDW
ncbi:MAG: acyl carrier protein [Bacteroidaceae bacterium]|nr:acyl carrier protein [Bacteroidaceae bacterium]